MKNFEGLGLNASLAHSLARMNYAAPTPIQEQAIPPALQGRDILGSAQTGTGKTAAFSIPLVESLHRSPHGIALVLTPTRELAKQVLDVIHQLLGNKSDINTAFIIGGDSMGKQLSQLKRQPRIIVGTPGRINDHLERGTLKLHDAHFLVLDETDRMLDMGFGVQLDRIIKYMPKKRQTLMFSATLPQEIIAMSGKYLNNPERVAMGATNVVATNIKQEAIRIEQSNKYQELQTQLHERTGSVIVFAKTKHGADRMAKNLRRDGFTADALHGDLRQHKRDKVMKNFREKNFRILVATDIAARGLDVPHIEHVINYDLPQVAEDYIHRMGRTARAGAKGSALSFVSPQESRKWHAIEILLDPDAKRSSRPPQSGKKKPRHKSNHRPGGKKTYGKTQGKPGQKPNKRPNKKFASKPEKRSDKRNEGQHNEGKQFEHKKDSKPARKEGKRFNEKSGKPSGKKSSKAHAGKRSGNSFGDRPAKRSGKRPANKFVSRSSAKPSRKRAA